MKEISRIKAKGQIGYAHIWLFLAFTIGFFAPLNIYLANISDFWYSPNLLLPLITGTFAIMALGLFLVTIILSKVLSDSIYHIYLLSVLLISTGLFIQGNFIPDSIGSLDGTDVTWNMMSVDAICSFVLWGIIVLVFVISIRNKIAEKIVKKSMPLVLMFFAIEIITIVTLVVMKGNFKDKNYYEVSTIGEFDYSADENFFLFILDNFDSSQLSNRLGEREKDIFKDFTYYPDTASVYGHTDLSVPQIITGINYYNDKSYGEYLKDAYDNGELLNYLRDEKWNMGLYTSVRFQLGM